MSAMTPAHATSLAALPLDVTELLFLHLDGTSLGRLAMTNRVLHAALGQSASAWKLAVRARFGVLVDVYPLQHAHAWRAIFANLMWDVVEVTRAASGDDVVAVYDRAPVYAMALAAKSIRGEIVLMEGLRRFPANAALIRLYASLLVPSSSSMTPLVLALS
ncbi:Aste57867_24978 [Aphanomyces stellatus]|uniref:Aste57867_24978 protein n=1 Tax=Aphanomyces stellatus TaxID=120398 RepID=A0A485LSL9_9STRA|nr:hypothetical protein As57867_024900 [Aphanomyces stellatus]VFU01609.1 Aste57867_24978 [Aphanomyces stellatus]